MRENAGFGFPWADQDARPAPPPTVVDGVPDSGQAFVNARSIGHAAGRVSGTSKSTRMKTRRP